MTLDSSTFILFYFIVLLFYWSVFSRWKKIFLLAISLFFYFSLSPKFGLTIFWSAGVTYIFSLLFDAFKKKKNNLQFKIIFLGIIIILGTLVFFKYLNYWDELLKNILPQIKFSSYVLPIGISFYTFQLIGYLIDIIKKKYPIEKNPINFLLFILFFPKLLAGPIERGNTLLFQIQKKQRWNTIKFISGLKLFVLGLFKKKVLADNLAIIVNRMFDHLPEYKGLSLILLMFMYSWQIYTDFSGYTDMARGIARTFGFELLENFNAPYISKSIRDFWRKWHISLSSWLRDYLYFPLGGSRKGLLFTILNTVIVFIICGIWHGATLNFVIWGATHGLIIAFERVLIVFFTPKKFYKIFLESVEKNSLLKTMSSFIQISYSFGIVTATWVIFRATTLSDALYIYKNAFVGLKNFINPTYVKATIELVFQHNTFEIIITTLLISSAIILEILSSKQQFNVYLQKMPTTLRYSIYIFVIVAILLFRQPETANFIYVTF